MRPQSVPLILTAIAAAIVTTAAAPLQNPSSSSPTCLEELDWVADYAARNYSGFETKTAGERGPAYADLLIDLRAGAARATTSAACDEVLAAWIDFFQDGHVSVRRAAPSPAAGEAGATAAGAGAPSGDDAIRERFADWPRREITETMARQRLAALGAGRSPIEGIWENADGAYRGAILRDEDGGGRYTMTILRADSVWWVPGQVKAIFEADGDARYQVRFFMRDHSENTWHGRVDRNALILNGSFVWFREWPGAPDDTSREAVMRTLNLAFAARDAAPGTVLLQIPSFDHSAAMDSLFEAEGDRIAAAERLIIDLRGNGGGSDYNYRQLVPLIYTDPIRIVSNEALATEDNIRVNEELAADTTLAEGIRAGIARSVEQMRTAEGGWYPFPDRTHEEAAVLDRPGRVDILVDRRCASSCEQFLLAARQSSKVTIYGEPTAGILDFGNVRSAAMPGGTLVLHHPTTRSKRLPDAPVDGIGVLPDVEIPGDVMDPVGWMLDRG